MKRLAIVIAILLGLSKPALGTDWFAKISGSGTNVGTATNPFTTWTAVNNNSYATGDDLYFFTQSGSYTHTIDAPGTKLVIDWDGTETNRVIIGAYHGSGTIGLGGYPQPVLDAKNTGGNLSSGLVRYYAPSGGNFVGYVTIRDLEVRNTIGYGIEVNGTQGLDGHVSFCEILNSITRNTDSMGIGLYRTWRSLVDGNKVYHANRVTDGVYHGGCSIDIGALGNEATSQYNIMSNNYVFGGNEGLGFYKGTRYWVCEYNQVVNNRVPIYVGNSRDGLIQHNIVYRTDQDTSSARESSSGGIRADSEDNVISIPKLTSNIEIAYNFVAGEFDDDHLLSTAGINITNNSGDSNFGSAYDWTVSNIKVHHNVLVDNSESNIRFAHSQYMSDVYVWANKSFIFESATNHVSETSPVNVNWYNPENPSEGNFFNSSVSGNAGATALPTNTYTMVKTSGWRSLPAGPGEVTAATFAINEVPSDHSPRRDASQVDLSGKTDTLRLDVATQVDLVTSDGSTKRDQGSARPEMSGDASCRCAISDGAPSLFSVLGLLLVTGMVYFRRRTKRP